MYTSFLPPSSFLLQVMLVSKGYAGGKNLIGGGDQQTAKYYGFALMSLSNQVKDGLGGFGLEFGNNGEKEREREREMKRQREREKERDRDREIHVETERHVCRR